MRWWKEKSPSYELSKIWENSSEHTFTYFPGKEYQLSSVSFSRSYARMKHVIHLNIKKDRKGKKENKNKIKYLIKQLKRHQETDANLQVTEIV